MISPRLAPLAPLFAVVVVADGRQLNEGLVAKEYLKSEFWSGKICSLPDWSILAKTIAKAFVANRFLLSLLFIP